MTWQGVLTDLRGNPLGELREATGRGLKRTLSRPRTARWAVQVDNPLARYHLDQDLTLAKWYDAIGTLRFCGPIMTFEKARDATGGTIAVTAVDPVGARLPHRLLGKSTQGASYASAAAQQDKGALITSMLADANAAGDTGIRIGNVVASSLGFSGPLRYKEADQAIAEVAAGYGSPDWDCAPVEPVADALGVQIGRLNVLPAIGATKDDVVFEFGTGKKNVASFSDRGDATALLNRGYILPPGFPDNATQGVLTAIDQPSIDLRGVHEGVVAGDLQVDPLRQALVDQHVAIRKQPRRVIAFQPIAEEDADTPLSDRRTPRLWIDYDVGDVVHFRAREPFKRIDAATGAVLGFTDVTTVDALFRIFVIDVALDDNSGLAMPTVTLVQEG